MSLELKEIINKIKYDEYGRPNGIIALNKKAEMTSHDLVNIVRKHYNFKKVGHAGTLDRFATGLMLLLIGKATKSAETLLGMNKQYKARILFGIETNTQDLEGEVLKINKDKFILKEEDYEKIKAKFIGKIQQNVSTFSSIKLGGEKLRVMMRDPAYNVRTYLKGERKYLEFTPKTENKLIKHEIEVPHREIEIFDLKILGSGKLKIGDYAFTDPKISNLKDMEFLYLDILVDCSKGTYIRQLAEDIGLLMNFPTVLIQLERTKIGDIQIEDTVELENRNS